MKLEAGKFYIAKDGFVWCCFQIDMRREVHARANCIRVLDSRIEYFYLDGRYDTHGEREHTLTEELSHLLTKEIDGSTLTHLSRG